MPTPRRTIHETTGLCAVCKDAVPAAVVAREDGAAWMEKECRTHGRQETRLSDDARWYERTRSLGLTATRPNGEKKPVTQGCPFDCGPCEEHEQRPLMPVVTITSACNLDCPICYVHNKNENAFHMPPEEFRRIVDTLVANAGGTLDVINLTGGEPFLHPRFMELLRIANDAGIHRVTICSNGIRLAKDEAMVEALARIGARVALSFDTFDPHTDVAMQGVPLLETKRRALELMEKHGVDCTLIPVMTRGVNDHEIGAILDFAMSLSCVRHVEVHTITYTGQGGKGYDPDRSGRISMREVLAKIEETTDGALTVDDFVASPCAHPLCYQVAYLLMDPDGGKPVPFTRFLGRDAFREALGDRLYMEPGPRLEARFREAIDRLWAEDGDPRLLALLRRAVEQNTLRGAEKLVKAVYVHSHMDEETFDVERVMQCCDSNCYADGKTIPVCSYNVIYRETEEHFMLQPKAWNESRRGFARGRLPVIHG